MDSQTIIKPVFNPLAAISEALNNSDQTDVEQIIAYLADENWWLNYAALITKPLKQIADERISTHLITALAHPHWWIRRLAADMLGELADSRAVESLIAALADETLWVQAAAAQALGELGQARAIGPLMLLRQNKNSGLRHLAAQALQAIGRQQALESFIRELLEPANLEEKLVNLLGHGDAPTRQAASETLAYLRQNSWSFELDQTDPAFPPRAEKPTVLHIDRHSEALKLSQWVLGEKNVRFVGILLEELPELELALQHQPDLILLHIRLSTPDGYEPCRRLRELTNTPIIFCTSRWDVSEGLKCGAVDYLIRPFNPWTLFYRCHQVLGLTGWPEQLDLNDSRFHTWR